jgi:hypothetical protein
LSGTSTDKNRKKNTHANRRLQYAVRQAVKSSPEKGHCKEYIFANTLKRSLFP